MQYIEKQIKELAAHIMQCTAVLCCINKPAHPKTYGTIFISIRAWIVGTTLQFFFVIQVSKLTERSSQKSKGSITARKDVEMKIANGIVG